jgi:Spy/CpxP family protein refolding chaperone
LSPPAGLPNLIVCSWWRDDTIRQNLGLSEPQVRRIEENYEERREDMLRAVRQMIKSNQELQALISGRQLTPDDIALKALGVEALRSRAFEISTVMYYEASRALTVEQYGKLRSWWTTRTAGSTRSDSEVFYSGSEWWKDPEVKRQVGLTDELSGRIEQSYQRRQRNAAPLIAELQTKASALDAMIAARNVRSEALTAHVLLVEALRSRINESRQVMLYRFYQEMTPEQYQKFDALMDARRRNRTGRGGAQ